MLVVRLVPSAVAIPVMLVLLVTDHAGPPPVQLSVIVAPLSRMDTVGGLATVKSLAETTRLKLAALFKLSQMMATEVSRHAIRGR